jgi:hypothetical protein
VAWLGLVLLLLQLLGRVGGHRERQQREGYHLGNMCCIIRRGAAAVGQSAGYDLRKVSRMNGTVRQLVAHAPYMLLERLCAVFKGLYARLS